MGKRRNRRRERNKRRNADRGKTQGNLFSIVRRHEDFPLQNGMKWVKMRVEEPKPTKINNIDWNQELRENRWNLMNSAAEALAVGEEAKEVGVTHWRQLSGEKVVFPMVKLTSTGIVCTVFSSVDEVTRYMSNMSYIEMKDYMWLGRGMTVRALKQYLIGIDNLS